MPLIISSEVSEVVVGHTAAAAAQQPPAPTASHCAWHKALVRPVANVWLWLPVHSLLLVNGPHGVLIASGPENCVRLRRSVGGLREETLEFVSTRRVR